MPHTSNLHARDVRVFVPAKDFALSKAFYAALGWTLTHVDERVTLMDLAARKLYLQDYYVKDWADNFMVYVTVESAAGWYAHATAVIASGKFPGAKVQAPQEAHGALVTYVWDPSGVLLHFAQSLERP